MNNYSTLLLDADDTLFDFQKSMDISIRELLNHIGISPTNELVDTYERINSGYWKKLERNEVTRAELVVARYRDFFNEVNISYDPKAAHEYYQARLSEKYFLLPDAIDFLDNYVSKMNLIMITNGNKCVQESRIGLAKISSYFDGIFISEDVGYEKPAKEYFDYVLNHIDEKDKNRILIIGDSLSSDIKGGINAGIKTCWYNPHSKRNDTDIVPDYEIKSLFDIKNIVGE